MSRIDLTRRRITYESGRKKEEFFLFAPKMIETPLGIRVHLGGKENLISLRDKINKYLESNE